MLKQTAQKLTRLIWSRDMVARFGAEILAAAVGIARDNGLSAVTLRGVAGRLDVYIHGGRMLWDYAAGRLILEEAGGCYSSLGGTPLTAGPAIKRSVIAAASPALFEQWRTWLHAHA